MSINSYLPGFDHVQKNRVQTETSTSPAAGAEGKSQFQASEFIFTNAAGERELPPIKGTLIKRQAPDTANLLKEAFLEPNPPLAAWLIQDQGASLSELEAFTSTLELTEEQSNFLEWLNLIAEPIAATPENLDHFALTLGLGYKAANLLVLEQKAEIMSQKLKCAELKVPPFLPISDYEMTYHLLNAIPSVYEQWVTFLELSFDSDAKQAFLEADTNEEASRSGLKITKEGERILTEIQDEIMTHFSENGSYQSLQITAWLEKVSPEFIIVRSTGKEDSDTNSNAGGNASIPYVNPDAQSISTAIGQVIASYFGEKSINQRILSGDRSLFTDDQPFIPVLLQEMVGENLAGLGSRNEEIPRSGVLFTCQEDKAEGVTLIQAGLGNNEGIVSAQVSVDSYFVKDGKVHAVVRNKDTRYVSVKNSESKITLQPIKNNNPALEKAQALPTPIILDLKRVADDISLSYANEEGVMKPMDMEYTVKLQVKGSDKPVIYLLQARPLMNTRGDVQIEHSYLDLSDLKKESQEKIFSNSVLLDGNAYVRKITDPESVIFAEDLPKGANIYLHEDIPAEKKVIILKKTAPSTSHEAVILRPKGIAVIVISDPQQYAAVKKHIHQTTEKEPVLIDTQRGILVSTSKESAEHMIRKGLVSYPIPLEVTVPPSHIMQQFNELGNKHTETAEELVENLNLEADALIQKLQRGNRLLLETDTKELLDMMATKDATTASLALATLLYRLKNRLAMSMKDTDDFRKDINQPMFQIFEAALNSCQKEIAPALETYPPQSLERLYPIKFLDAMIHQKMSPDVIDNPSYYQVLALDMVQRRTMEEASKMGVKYDGPNAQKLILLHRLAQLSYNEECKKNWLELVGDLAKIEHQGEMPINRLLLLVNKTSSLNISDKWLNTSFNQIWMKHQHKTPNARVEAVISELEQMMETNKKTLDWIKERNGTLTTIKQGTKLWADPGFAKKQTSKLIDVFTSDLGFEKTVYSRDSIKAIYDQSDEFGKLALLQFMRDAVNTYDSIIKATKESTSFSNDQLKAERVGKLLKGYFKMMEATFSLVPVSDQNQLICTYNKNWNGKATFFDHYIEKLRNGYEYAFGFDKYYKSIGFNKLAMRLKLDFMKSQDQFEARPEFAVDSLIVGSKADLNFSVHWPNNLEEYFTTFHQNMEQVIKLLNTKNGLNQDLLSGPAKELSEITKQVFEQDISYLNLEDGKLHAGFQIPLRQHSASFVISYDPKNQDAGMDLNIQIFGNDELNRWDWAATFGSVLAYTMAGGFADDTPPQINYLKPEGVAFTLKIPPNFKDGAELMDAISCIMNELTFNGDGNPRTLLKFMQTGSWNNSYYSRPSSFKGLGTIDWEKLDPECFKYTLHINLNLIDQLLKEGKNETAAKVAINSLKGMAYYGIEDYYRNIGESLAERAVKELEQLIPKEPGLHPEIQRLIEDPDVQDFPGISELQLELDNVKLRMGTI